MCGEWNKRRFIVLYIKEVSLFLDKSGWHRVGAGIWLKIERDGVCGFLRFLSSSLLMKFCAKIDNDVNETNLKE